MINKEIYDIEKISEGPLDIYKIYERFQVAMDLVCGKERACLIDTAYGLNDLSEVVASLTDLPVTVINTHGHIDHVLGNHFFEQVYMHPADQELYQEIIDGFADMITQPWVRETYGEFIKDIGPDDISFPAAKDISDGDVIDLGGKQLKVIEVPGHTPGSIMLTDPDEKICFSGDSIIEHLWLFLDESLPSDTYRRNLIRAVGILKDEDIRKIYSGHYAYKPLTISDAESVISIMDKICSGEAEGQPFENEVGSGTEYVSGDFSVLCRDGSGIPSDTDNG